MNSGNDYTLACGNTMADAMRSIVEHGLNLSRTVTFSSLVDPVFSHFFWHSPPGANGSDDALLRIVDLKENAPILPVGWFPSIWERIFAGKL